MNRRPEKLYAPRRAIRVESWHVRTTSRHQLSKTTKKCDRIHCGQHQNKLPRRVTAHVGERMRCSTGNTHKISSRRIEPPAVDFIKISPFKHPKDLRLMMTMQRRTKTRRIHRLQHSQSPTRRTLRKPHRQLKPKVGNIQLRVTSNERLKKIKCHCSIPSNQRSGSCQACPYRLNYKI